ncbi:CoA pyrophosphatase [Aquincola sp. S2]|uniref:CoA pyrophosphatase n=1 Tax=Pseudaquabacterium terrae TaxID=2732868 RepID=A0ABX2EFR1_9BURK|nr:CoA pyrophosphatase [Aquabacterium terrae]NRF67438.1 CoA pyrophosphatase [Aquabacterium terrae]
MRADAALQALLRERLAAWPRQAIDVAALRHAAVALVLIDEGDGAHLPGVAEPPAWSDEAALLVTLRAATLRRHGGQFALPGGRIDDGETPEQAALRELAEEVDLRLDDDAVLGRLDDYATRSGYVITPVVLWGGAARDLRGNPDEVASIHRIPIAELQRPDAPLLTQEAPGESPVLRMPVGDGWIAAPTAALLYQFREVCIEGRPTRVAHFGQPRFAWQ